MTAQDVLLPASPDIERLVLGSIMLNGERFSDVAQALDANDLILEKHRRIWACMRDLQERGESVDRITVANELQVRRQLESVDGLSYLVSLDQGLPELTNLDAYIRILKEKSVLRRTMTVCQQIIDRCALASEPSDEILRTAEGFLEQVKSNDSAQRFRWLTPWQVLEGGIESVLFPASGRVGLQTPWQLLTEMTSGWSPGD